MTDFKPMLAGKFDESKLKFPVYTQPKLDGIRASVVNGKLVSRTLKPIPNWHIRDMLERPMYEGLDGELIVGSATADDCYRQTCSGVMSPGGAPDFRFFVFDRWDMPASSFRERYMTIGASDTLPHVEIVSVLLARDDLDLNTIEAAWVAEGYEGIILRSPDGLYKFGRGTAGKQDLVKLKRFTDFEAIIVGAVEEQHNGNEATTNELGRTARSSAKAGKTGKGTLGKFVCQKARFDHPSGIPVAYGPEFGVGTGFSAADRKALWAEFQSGRLRGKIVKVKSFPVGQKDKPRHPVFVGMRSMIDLGDPA